MPGGADNTGSKHEQGRRLWSRTWCRKKSGHVIFRIFACAKLDLDTTDRRVRCNPIERQIKRGAAIVRRLVLCDRHVGAGVWPRSDDQIFRLSALRAPECVNRLEADLASGARCAPVIFLTTYVGDGSGTANVNQLTGCICSEQSLPRAADRRSAECDQNAAHHECV